MAIIAIGVLFGVTMATNELSKETKASTADDGAATLRDKDGNPISVESAAVDGITLWDIPKSPLDELSGTKDLVVPLPGTAGNAVMGDIASVVRNDVSGSTSTETTVVLSGGIVLEFDPSGTSVDINVPGKEETTTLTRGPLDEDGMPTAVLASSAIETNSTNSTTTVAAIRKFHALGYTNIVSEHSDGHQIAHDIRHEHTHHHTASLLQTESISSITGMQRVRRSTRRRGSREWSAPDPLPGFPSFTYKKCRVMQRKIRFPVKMCYSFRSQHWERRVKGSPASKCRNLKKSSQGKMWFEQNCNRFLSVALCMTKICGARELRRLGGAKINACKDECKQVPEETRFGILVYQQEGSLYFPFSVVAPKFIKPSYHHLRRTGRIVNEVWNCPNYNARKGCRAPAGTPPINEYVPEACMLGREFCEDTEVPKDGYVTRSFVLQRRTYPNPYGITGSGTAAGSGTGSGSGSEDGAGSGDGSGAGSSPISTPSPSPSPSPDSSPDPSSDGDVIEHDGETYTVVTVSKCRAECDAAFNMKSGGGRRFNRDCKSRCQRMFTGVTMAVDRCARLPYCDENERYVKSAGPRCRYLQRRFRTQWARYLKPTFTPTLCVDFD